MAKPGESPTQIASVLDHFVTELEQGKAPKIEDYLGKIPESLQERYLMDLIELQTHFRLQAGDYDLSPDVYLQFGDAAVDFARQQIVAHHPDYDSLLANLRTRSFADDSSIGQIDRKNELYSAGSVIGRYTLREKLGEGGMGSVWKAEQQTPVRRDVALKLVKGAISKNEVVARFEAERQALATMNHPNIAKILDGGATDEGGPYFVMDLIAGTPITHYCDQQKLKVKDRLKLFLPICRAIQHAHQKGIIHRDIKPSNVLIAIEDDEPVTKVIDFGLAKAIDNTTNILTTDASQTGHGGFLGTLHYMSPEQAGGDSLDIDTRTDVYSMGVLLYELLTGTTPLFDNSLAKETLLQSMQTIRETDPPRPSVRLGSVGDSLSVIGDQRGIAPTKLKSELADELDWVVMKAIAKQPDHRYQSAGGLAEELQRYLDDEPVLARPSTTRYRTEKFVRRNKGMVASLATIAALLVAGIGGATWFALGERTQRALATKEADRANKETERALLAESLERANAEQAAISAKRSSDALQIFTSSFVSVDPREGADSKMLAKDVLFGARDSLDDSELDDEGRAELLQSLTTSFHGIGEYEAAIDTAKSAIEILNSIVGPEDTATLNAKIALAENYIGARMVPEALALLEDLAQQSESLLGQDHVVTLKTLSQLATAYHFAEQPAQAIGIFETVIERRKIQLGPAHPDTLTTMDQLGNSFYKSGQTEQAKAQFEQVLELRQQELGVDHPGTIVSLENLARTYRRLGRTNESVEMLEQVVELKQEKLGDEHPETAIAVSNLGVSYFRAKRVPDALKMFELALELRKKNLAPDHPDVIKSSSNLASVYFMMGRHSEATDLFEELLEQSISTTGESHPGTLSIMGNLGSCYAKLGRYDDSIELNERVLRIRKEAIGPKHPDTLLSMNNLGTDYLRVGRLDEAVVLLKETLELRRSELGDQHPHTLSTMKNLADSYYQQATESSSMELFRETASLLERVLPFSDKINGVDRSLVLKNMTDSYAKAIELCEQAVKAQSEELGPNHPKTQATALELEELLLKQDPERAEKNPSED